MSPASCRARESGAPAQTPWRSSRPGAIWHVSSVIVSGEPDASGHVSLDAPSWRLRWKRSRRPLPHVPGSADTCPAAETSPGDSPRKSDGGLPASLAAGGARDLSRLAHSEDLQRFSAGSAIACWRSRLLLCGPSHSVHGPGSAIIGTCKIGPLTCNFVEPPIGIEPMTYALRGCSRALLARSKPAQASCSQVAAGGDRWLLMAVRGHLGDTGP